MPFCVLICRKTINVPTGYGNDQNHHACHREGQLYKDGHNGGQAGGYGRGKVHEQQFDQFDGTFQTAVQATVNIAGHVFTQVRQRSFQQ